MTRLDVSLRQSINRFSLVCGFRAPLHQEGWTEAGISFLSAAEWGDLVGAKGREARSQRQRALYSGRFLSERRPRPCTPGSTGTGSVCGKVWAQSDRERRSPSAGHADCWCCVWRRWGEGTHPRLVLCEDSGRGIYTWPDYSALLL